jgi:hypothetical protein
MFRALAHFDSDFSRHIEGNTLRITWHPDALFTLVTRRLRIAMNFQSIERDVRVWNRFAQRELSDRSGFESCLRHTLYRPRDILVLLNLAYMMAARGGRSEIVGDDVEATARSISKDRLGDLLKEYDTVLPGLTLFARAFQNGPVASKLSEIVQVLEEAIASADYTEQGARDFALFNSGREAAAALYGVGFFGVAFGREGRYRFCHDGSLAEIDPAKVDVTTVIHPCYWSALNLHGDASLEEVAVQIDDDLYQKGAEGRIKDLRVKLLGQIVGELPKLPLGHEGAKEFEDWVFRTVKMLFGGACLTSN